MNFIQQLMKAPVIPQRKSRAHNPNKCRPEYKSSRGKYRLYLEGQRRTTTELASLIGVSYNTARSMIFRLEDQGVITRVGTKSNTGGKVASVYTWTPGAE